jgi:osmotically-inducible protein OsmY
VIRPRQRIAFSFPKLEPSSVNTSLHARLGRLEGRGLATDGVTVTLDEKGQVALKGEVDSEHTRKLVEMMARLEPGVRKVQNELTVKADSSSD